MHPPNVYANTKLPGRGTRKSGVLGSIPGLVSPSAFSRRAVVSYWPKYVHKVLVNRLGGLSLPWKSVVRLIDRPDMTLDVDVKQQYNNNTRLYCWYISICSAVTGIIWG